MPYSSTLKFIQVAIPKTGTTSLAHAMRKITEQHQAEFSLFQEKITPEFRARHNLNEIGDKKPGKAKHLSALQIKYILGEEEFNRCFKFSVVRNPWARAVSRYFFNHTNLEPSEEEKISRGTRRKFHNLEFNAWIEHHWKRHKKQPYELATEQADR